MIAYGKEKYARNVLLLALVACLAPLASPADAQYLMPPGFYGYGWGEHPYWLDPSFEYSYEADRSREYPRDSCLNEEVPIYDRRAPYRYLGVKDVHVCRPDNVYMNR
jgi:hypothetical protein